MEYANYEDESSLDVMLKEKRENVGYILLCKTLIAENFESDAMFSFYPKTFTYGNYKRTINVSPMPDEPADNPKRFQMVQSIFYRPNIEQVINRAVKIEEVLSSMGGDRDKVPTLNKVPIERVHTGMFSYIGVLEPLLNTNIVSFDSNKDSMSSMLASGGGAKNVKVGVFKPQKSGNSLLSKHFTPAHSGGRGNRNALFNAVRGGRGNAFGAGNNLNNRMGGNVRDNRPTVRVCYFPQETKSNDVMELLKRINVKDSNVIMSKNKTSGLFNGVVLVKLNSETDAELCVKYFTDFEYHTKRLSAERIR